MVPEVADPHVLVHVGVVEVLTQPADVTPVEIPLAFAAVRRHRSDLRTEDFWGLTAHEWVEGGVLATGTSFPEAPADTATLCPECLIQFFNRLVTPAPSQPFAKMQGHPAPQRSIHRVLTAASAGCLTGW